MTEAFVPTSTDGKSELFELVVYVKDVNIGGGLVAETVLKQKALKSVLGIEGAATLNPVAFSSDTNIITFNEPVNDKTKFIVSPPYATGNSFFNRVKVK